MFKKLDEGFTCLNCGKKVHKLVTTSRDHCPFCLYSLHVDITPGDRLNNCKGLLEPIGVIKRNGKDKILYKCEKCRTILNCIIARDDVIPYTFV